MLTRRNRDFIKGRHNIIGCLDLKGFSFTGWRVDLETATECYILFMTSQADVIYCHGKLEKFLWPSWSMERDGDVTESKKMNDTFKNML